MRHRPHVAANASTVARRLDEITRIGKEFRTFLPRLAADDWQALPVVDTGAEGVSSSSHVHAALFTAPHRSEAATSSWVLMVNGGATRRSVSVVAGGRKLSKTLEPWDVVMVDDELHVASKTDDPAARVAPPPRARRVPAAPLGGDMLATAVVWPAGADVAGKTVQGAGSPRHLKRRKRWCARSIRQ